METRHIKLDYEEALNAKIIVVFSVKPIANSKRLQTYRVYRQKEHIYKNKLRISVKNLSAKTNQLLDSMPQDITIKNAVQEKNQLKKPKEIIIKEDKSQIQKELDEIRKRLERLNKTE